MCLRDGRGIVLLLGAVAFTVFNYRLARGEAKAHAASDVEKADVAWTTIALSVVGIVVGIGGLALGGDWLVRGATEIALDIGVSEYLIGLTVVAVGTSLPELATAFVGVAKGQSELVLGGIVGSNIYNLLLILAAGMIVLPLDIQRTVLNVQIPLMVGLTLVLVPILRDGLHVRTRWGWLLLAAYVGTTLVAIGIDPGS